tara:strand:+ start:113 stop:343 length:231 start_codon:yes stop_codon:yes gene_type:complete
MAKEKKQTGTVGNREVVSLLQKIEAHLASLVYYQQPSRGFEAGVQKAIAQPFVTEDKNSKLESMIREEIKKALGDK